ncbi:MULTISPECIES: hypothetical protein [unclassified Streptomyces]|uniref:hypothetical protein n=1 Tax=unclassified Streptomyces TaxID=2593676 RepID=UPI0022579045|nr:MULTISPECIES: hypothetical protein [unclassified Streptomyces]MCX4407039.1 hypothetical protein [Streptomyces sp. NBC_01764]MCX5188273.1 hypothetical protein [Streptomyces sp. NBC_00268]
MPERAVVFHARALLLPGGDRAATGLPEQWSVPARDFEADRYTDRASAWRTTQRPGPGRKVEAQVRGTDKAAVEAAFTEACAQAVDRARNPGNCDDTDDW